MYLIYYNTKHLAALTVLFVGDIKCSENNYFSGADKGQVFYYGELILESQPLREFVIVFLTNCNVIQFFRVSRSDDSYTYTETIVMDLMGGNEKEGCKCLNALIKAKETQLGFVTVEHTLGEEFKPNRYLGSGATSHVYQAEFKNGDVVIKHFKNEFKHLCEQEANTMKALQASKLQTVPTFLKSSGESIAMNPVAKRNNRQLTGFHFLQILFTLQEVNKLKYVHRDIRPDNILFLNDKATVFLCDWGFAVDEGVRTYGGTIHFASKSVLDQLRKNPISVRSTFADDLFSLVCVLYVSQFPSEYEKLVDIDSLQLKDIIKFWEEVRSKCSWWEAAFKAAESSNTNNLIQLIVSYFPLSQTPEEIKQSIFKVMVSSY